MKYKIKDIKNKDRIESFGYETVRKIMELLNWEWYLYPDPMAIPNEQQMKYCVKELTTYVLSTLEEGKDSTCSSGGFEVTCKIQDGELLMRIEFIPVRNLFWERTNENAN